MTDQLPADIAEAIEAFQNACYGLAVNGAKGFESKEDAMRAALDAVILKHLRSAQLERVRHVKRGTEYEVLGEAEAQIASAQAESDRFGNWRGLYEGHKLTVYRSVDNGKLWCRYTDEFRDGRFVPSPTLGRVRIADEGKGT